MKLTLIRENVFLVKATEVIMKKLKILFKRPKPFIYYYYLFIIYIYYLFIYLFLETFKWHMD